MKLQWKQGPVQGRRRAAAVGTTGEEADWQLSGEMEWRSGAGVEEERCRDQRRSEEG